MERVLVADAFTRDDVIALADGYLPAGGIGEDIDHDRVVSDPTVIHPRGIVIQDAPYRGIGVVEFTHRVHVIQAHLAIALVDGLEVPLQVVALDRPSLVAGRAAVVTDVVSRKDGTLPQRAAGGGNVVLGHVREVGRTHSVVAVIVPAHDVGFLVLVKQRTQCVGVIQTCTDGEVVVEAPGGNVQAHHHGRVIVHQRQVLAQPLHLLVCDIAAVVAAAGNTLAVILIVVGDIQVIDIVEHDIVYLAQVETVVVGADDVAPCRYCFLVGVLAGGYAGIVVVVADDGPQRHGIFKVLHILHEVCQVVVVLGPEDIPSEVAEYDRVDGRAVSTFNFLVEAGDEALLEIGSVTAAACKVGVGGKDDLMLVIIYAAQREIVYFIFGDVTRVERCPELRVEAIGKHGLITAGQRVEDVTVQLGT